MRNDRGAFGAVWTTLLLLAVSFTGLYAAAAQTQPPKSTNRTTPATPVEQDDEHLAATRKQLMELLRMSPKVASFVRRDPLLLSDQEFVTRTNPKLAEFLQGHPEITRNPEFYLFADVPNSGRGLRDMGIEDPSWVPRRDDNTKEYVQAFIAFTVFVVILGVLLWLLRVLLENRRWGRVFKVQTDIYNKLLDKFSTNEEMLAYIRSESGKRFLDSATMPFGTGMQPQASSPVARVLTPLQLGVVLTIVGIGLMYLRTSIPDALAPLSIFGTLALTLGIGFIVSAGLAFGLARQLGLLPQSGVLSDSGLNQQQDIR